MRRHMPRLLLTGALLSPVTLYALGLGEIRLNSALNQPFDAEIELLSPTPEEWQPEGGPGEQRGVRALWHRRPST